MVELVVKTDPPKTTADTFIRSTPKRIVHDDYGSIWDSENNRYHQWSNGYNGSPTSYGRGMVKWLI